MYKRFIAVIAIVGTLGLTGCAGEPQTITVTETAVETVTPEPVEVEVEVPVDDGVDAVAGGGAFTDGFFADLIEQDFPQVYDYFGTEAEIVEFALTVCGAFDREGTGEDITGILRDTIPNVDERMVAAYVSVVGTANYCPQYNDKWEEFDSAS